MRLTLNTRDLGNVRLIRCEGRLVAGAEAESLRQCVESIFSDHCDVVLHLGGVTFIDSSGLGTLVRLLSKAHAAGGDLKLCHVPPAILKVLTLTNISKLFDMHDSEEETIAAFFSRKTTRGQAPATGRAILCVDGSADVLAYLRELLRQSGYHVLTSSNLPDALILVRAAQPALVIVGPNLAGSSGVKQAFSERCSVVPVVNLGHDFSKQDAGEASQILTKVRAQLPADTE